MDGLKRFVDVYPEMNKALSTNMLDHVASIGDVLGGYAGARTLRLGDGETADLSSTAEKALFAKVGLPVAAVRSMEGHPDIQAAMVQAKLKDSQIGKDMISLRGIQLEGGMPVYKSVVDASFVPLNNSQLLGAIADAIPETAMVHRANISGGTMMLRLVDENWYHDLGPGGRALTAVVIRSDMMGQTATTIVVGVARVACWNYTLASKPVFEHHSGYLLPEKVTSAVHEAVGQLDDVSNGVTKALAKYQDVDVRDVEGMIGTMSKELSLPDYAKKAAESWYGEFGKGATLFWVIQAVSHGADSMTHGKRQRWAFRERAEFGVMDMAEQFATTGELRVCTCSSCGRPVETFDDGGVIDAQYTVG